MLFTKLGSDFVLRLEQDDDIIKSLREFAEKWRIRAGFFEGIGSLNKAKLGHYDFKETRTYKYEIFEEDLEILTLSGNMATMNNRALPHAHVTLGRRDFSVLGGHLEEGSVANMVEIKLGKRPGRLVKARDEGVGLNLLQLPRKFYACFSGNRAVPVRSQYTRGGGPFSLLRAGAGKPFGYLGMLL